MSQFKEVILQYNQRLTQATTDHAAVLQILSEYRKSITDLKDCRDDINSLLSWVLNNHSEKHLVLLLIAAYTHPSPIYVENLCALLELHDPSLPNEQIVDVLYKIPSPTAIPALKKACSIKLPHDDYDEFGVKCLDALAAINTPEAWISIHDSVGSSSPRIQQHVHELEDWRKPNGN